MRLPELIVTLGCALTLLLASSANSHAQSNLDTAKPASSKELVLEGIEDWFTPEQTLEIQALPLVAAEDIFEHSRHSIRLGLIRACMTTMTNQLAEIANRQGGEPIAMNVAISDEPPVSGPAKYYLQFFGPSLTMSLSRPALHVWYRVDLVLIVRKRDNDVYEYDVHWLASSFAIGNPNDEPPVGRLSDTGSEAILWMELFIRDVRARLAQCGRDAAVVEFIPNGVTFE